MPLVTFGECYFWTFGTRTVRTDGTTGGLELGILGCGVNVPPDRHGGAITIRDISGIGEPVYGST